ncbi:MAG: glutamate racemase [Rhabdochlamydiaceae bacterium]
MQSPPNSSIGVFDSGFGVLTVLKELQKTLPYEQLIYFGDTARLPYGTKSRDTIIRYTTQNCSFLAAQGVKLIIIACNTATSMALDAVAGQFTFPIVGVIDPVIEKVIKTSPTGRIGILGTRATVISGVYQQKIHDYLPHADITAIASPLLVSLVEEGFIDHPMTHLAIQEYVRPLLLAGVDTVILACTHFPLLKTLIEKALGPAIKVIDPALASAKATKKALSELNLLSDEKNPLDPLFCVTDDPDKFKRLGPQFLGQSITHVKLCDTSYILDQLR